MLLAFGALIAAGVPVLLAVTSVAATMGIAAPLSHLIHSEPTVTSMIVLIGMAVGVDYSLFYLKREREERAKGRTTLDAVEIAAATSGHSILVSGAAVIGSMAGLFIVGGATFDSLATGAIIVVAVAVIGSVTVLPALLAKLGRWSDRPRSRCCGGSTVGSATAGSAAACWRPSYAGPSPRCCRAGRPGAARRPVAGHEDEQRQPGHAPRGRSPRCRRCTRSLLRSRPQGTTATVVVHGPADEQARYRAALQHLETTAAAAPGFAPAGDGAIETSTDGRTQRLTLPIRWSWSDPRATQAVQQLRDRARAGRPRRARRSSTPSAATWPSPSTTRTTSRAGCPS